MQTFELSRLPVWKTLATCAKAMNRPENHLRRLLADQDRLQNFSLQTERLFFDFSRQRIDAQTLGHLLELAENRQLKTRFAQMVSGAIVNTTEHRAALHTAARRFDDDAITVDGQDIMSEIRSVREKIRTFTAKLHQGRITAADGRPFTHVVVVGIGGSYLGTEFVSTALAAYADKKIALHYLANVDIHNFGAIADTIDPVHTLWIVISKSYTTAETLANTAQIYAYLQDHRLDPAHHIVTVTAQGSPGDDPSNPVLAAFHMFDFIGGRYSVTSAVGGVPLSLYLGWHRFEALLKGAEAMDRHAAEAPPHANLPLIAALLSVWNHNFLGYPAQAVIPYASPLSKLAPHVQQLNMESNGKAVTARGERLDVTTGPIIFGEPGTNAQHSFFQLAHQGRPFPIDFIGVVNPQYTQYRNHSKGVTNHQELWANLIAQPMALALGQSDPDPARQFDGNRPSSTLILDDLTPESVGGLLAFYEARTVYEAFIWGINPFDQFGVQLGKTIAGDLRAQIAAKNNNAAAPFKTLDPVSRYYAEMLYREN